MILTDSEILRINVEDNVNSVKLSYAEAYFFSNYFKILFWYENET